MIAGLLMFAVNCLVLCSLKCKGRLNTTALAREVKGRVKKLSWFALTMAFVADVVCSALFSRWSVE